MDIDIAVPRLWRFLGIEDINKLAATSSAVYQSFELNVIMPVELYDEKTPDTLKNPRGCRLDVACFTSHLYEALLNDRIVSLTFVLTCYTELPESLPKSLRNLSLRINFIELDEAVAIAEFIEKVSSNVRLDVKLQEKNEDECTDLIYRALVNAPNKVDLTCTHGPGNLFSLHLPPNLSVEIMHGAPSPTELAGMLPPLRDVSLYIDVIADDLLKRRICKSHVPRNTNHAQVMLTYYPESDITTDELIRTLPLLSQDVWVYFDQLITDKQLHEFLPPNTVSCIVHDNRRRITIKPSSETTVTGLGKLRELGIPMSGLDLAELTSVRDLTVFINHCVDRASTLQVCRTMLPPDLETFTLESTHNGTVRVSIPFPPVIRFAVDKHGRFHVVR